MTVDQKDALTAAVSLAMDDQEHYLKSGDFDVDYGDEWAEAAALKAEMWRNVAGAFRELGESGMATSCDEMATGFEEAAAEAAAEVKA
jgi:hypothetical protein